MENTLWTNDIKMPEFKNEISKNQTDVLIIGGGITGILCALLLKEEGVDCLLLEKDSIASKTTAGTTGKITCQHNLLYSNLISSFGLETAQKYYNINNIALAKYRELSKRFPYDFEDTTAYTYTLTNMKKIEDELKAYERIGVKAKIERELELPFMVKGSIALKNQGQLHPLKLISQIAKGLNIVENTFVKRIENGYVETQRGQIIRAKKIIVATHFPIINKKGLYFLKLYQNRSYFVAIKNAEKIKNMYIDEACGGLSLRSYKDYLLIGGGAHRTGTKTSGFQAPLSFVGQYYKNAEICFQWAAQDTMSLDKLPYIGQYSKSTKNIFTATGFNKWGLTGAMTAAMILCDLVTEKKNEFSDIFSPWRSIFKPQLMINTMETLSNYVKPTPKRCSHLGCALKWNKYEHSWDCPCHGSRFSNDGKILDNPANKDLNQHF